MTSALSAQPSPAPHRGRLALYLDLIRWNRPAGWLLLLWPTLGALWFAAGGWPGWHLLAVFVVGTILMRSAGCCVNDVADRDFDRHVKRTAQRPVTSGAISVREALTVGAVFYLAIAVAAAQALWHWRLIRGRTRDGCFKAFRLNHWLGFTVFAGVVAGYAAR